MLAPSNKGSAGDPQKEDSRHGRWLVAGERAREKRERKEREKRESEQGRQKHFKDVLAFSFVQFWFRQGFTVYGLWLYFFTFFFGFLVFLCLENEGCLKGVGGALLLWRQLEEQQAFWVWGCGCATVGTRSRLWLTGGVKRAVLVGDGERKGGGCVWECGSCRCFCVCIPRKNAKRGRWLACRATTQSARVRVSF